MATTLDSVMRKHRIGDAELGESCNPPIHRTLIWCYRRLKKTPRSDTAQAIIEALGKRGIEITLTELLGRPEKRRAKSAA